MIWLLGLLGLLGLGAGVAALLSEDLKGKKFSVLGERETGKTALINFLTTGTLPQEYVQTLYPKKTVKNHLELKDLKLVIEESKDVPGSIDSWGDWKDITQQADIVL